MRPLLTLLAVCALFAQEQQPFTLQSTTKVVLVNVIATDRKGAPVDDLEQADFELLENGKPRKIAFFGKVHSDAFAVAPVALPQNVFSNRHGKAGLPASVTVILLDTLNTDWGDQVQARQHVLRFLSTIQAQDRVALYTLGGRLRVLHEFTTDTAELIAKLKSFRGDPSAALQASTAAPGQQADVGGTAAGAGDPLSALLTQDPSAPTPQEVEFFTTDRVLRTLSTMDVIAAHLSGLPGRKSLIWVSAGFPLSLGFGLTGGADAMNQFQRSYTDDVMRTIRRLNHAGVSVYPVDARGLMVGASYHASQRGAPSTNAPRFISNLDTMQELAERTGGRAFYNRNDIDKAVRTAADDGRVTYTLAYYPAGEPDNKYHNIKVRVLRPGLNVRHRSGYFAFKDQIPTEENVKRDLNQAVWSPLDASAIAMNARVDHNAKSDDFEILLQVEAGDLTIERRGERWVGRVDFVFSQKDAQGRSHTSIGDSLALNLLDDNYKKLATNGLVYRKRVRRAAEATALRIVARDAATGLMGSISVPLKSVRSYAPAQ